MKTGHWHCEHSAQRIFEYCENVGERSLTVRSMVRSRIPDVGAAASRSHLRGQVHGLAEAAGGGAPADRRPRAAEVSARKHYTFV